MDEFCENEPAVKIAVRQKPVEFLNNREAIIKYEPKSSNIIIVDDRPYVFDQVFGPQTTQQQLFEEAIKPLVDKVLKGFNCTALAYGQTGTGKSYTMGLGEEVEEKHVGIVRRCLAQIMEADLSRYDLKVSFVEIYNEKVFDLLSANANEPIMSKGFKYPGGIRQSITNMADCNEILRQGVNRRHVRPTTMNSQSSRSHVIFTIEVASNDIFKPSRAFLNLVDLAGSEGVRRTGHTGQAMSEGVNINQGLLCLGKIIQAMSTGKKVVHFRDSVLGAVLQDSLNPNSYLSLLACISPERIDLSETLSTIRFAQRAKNLKFTPQINSKNKPKTPFNAKTTQFVRPLKTPFKRAASENQNSNTFCTPAKERRTENNLNYTDIGLTPKEKDKAQKQFKNTTKTPFALPPPISHSSTVNSTTQRESLFEQTIESWSLNASTSTVTTYEAPSCIEKPISYSPIVEKCMEKFGTVIEDKMQQFMESFMNGNSQLRTPAQQLQSTQQRTMRSELKSLLTEIMSERKTKSPTRAETNSSPAKVGARCQLFTTSSPVFKVPEIPTNRKTNFSALQISNDSIDNSVIENTIRPARRSMRLENRNVRQSTSQLPAFDDSILQNTINVEERSILRRSLRRRSKSVPINADEKQIAQQKPKSNKNKSNKSSAYNALFANCSYERRGATKSSKSTNITKHRKAILELLNQGSMKELQILPQIGLKTAYQIITQRTLNGKFKNLAQVESLPMWRGSAWERFAQANMLV